MDLTSGLTLAGITTLSFALSFYGASVGLVLGQLRLPLLVYFTGSPAVGAATSLAISATGGFTGAVRHGREGNIRWRLLLSVGAPSAVAAFFAARWAGGIDPRWVGGSIGVVLLASGLELSVRRGAPEAPDVEAGDQPRPVAEAGLGAILGTLSGLVGLMLGSLRLPLLIRWLRVHAPIAVGSNMAIGCLTGALGAAGALTAGNISALAFFVVSPATIAGAWLGARVTTRLDPRALRRLIGITVVLSGLWMMFENFVL